MHFRTEKDYLKRGDTIQSHKQRRTFTSINLTIAATTTTLIDHTMDSSSNSIHSTTVPGSASRSAAATSAKRTPNPSPTVVTRRIVTVLPGSNHANNAQALPHFSSVFDTTDMDPAFSNFLNMSAKFGTASQEMEIRHNSNHDSR